MASLYRRKNSPHWWVKWRDPDTNKIRRESTGFRIGVGPDRRKALKRRDALALSETKFSASNKKEEFSNWVPDFITAHYKDMTQTRVKIAWRFISEFLEKIGIKSPGALRRQHCLQYFTWRTTSAPGHRTVRRSTAQTELAYFSAILTEAVLRGYCEQNPCFRLNIKCETPKPKLEMSEQEITLIRNAIKTLNARPVVLARLRKICSKPFDVQEFLHVSFEIAIHQGCRLKETYLEVFNAINIEAQEITFHAKQDCYYTTALHPNLIPLIHGIRNSRRFTYNLPEGLDFSAFRRLSSFYWCHFLQGIGLPHLSFHCTRVTVITRLARAGVPERVVMKLVNHSSLLIHRIYQRFGLKDIKDYWATGDHSHPSSLNPDKSPRAENPDVPPAT